MAESFDQKRHDSIEQLNAEKMRILKTAVTVQQALASQQARASQTASTTSQSKPNIAPEHQAKLDALKQQSSISKPSPSPSASPPSPS
jgi:type II secretory pathway component GspD/PulD (secretin)